MPEIYNFHEYHHINLESIPIQKPNRAESKAFAFAVALIMLPFTAIKTVFRWAVTPIIKHNESEAANELLKELEDTAGDVDRFYIKKHGSTRVQKMTEKTFEKKGDNKITGSIKFDDQSKYEGTFEEDLALGISGKGRVTMGDNVTYEGVFKHGQLIEGIKTMANGSYAKGTFNDKGNLDGKGKQYLISTGISNEGTFKNGKLVEGSRQDSNGTLKTGTFDMTTEKLISGLIIGHNFYYEGIFDKNEYLLTGSMKTPEGLLYAGRLPNNKLDGEGTKILRDGTIEKGEFRKNKLDGEGTKTFPDGTIYEGTFKDGKLTSGSIKMPNGYTVTGDFITQKIKRKNGITENGIFSADKLIRGTRTRTVIDEGIPMNIMFTGNFINDALEGKGSMTFEGDSIIEGDFSQGWLTKGTLRQIGGSEVINGRFVEDVSEGQDTITLPNGVLFQIVKK
jgi:hypothetical protein